MKKFVTLLLMMVLCFFATSCDLFEKTQTVNPAKFYYHDVTLDEINEEFEKNEVRAKDKYEGMYVSFSAYIDRISEDEIELCSTNIELLDSFSPASVAKVANSSLNMKILTLNKGDLVSVKGKITKLDVFVAVQVYIDMYLIE